MSWEGSTSHALRLAEFSLISKKFSIITMDYDKVPLVGQAFADEIYRVFKEKHPEITIKNVHMNDSVRFMVERAKKEANIGR